MKRFSIVAMAVLLITTAAFAQGPGPGGPPPGGPGGDPLAEYLALTNDQKTAWQTIQNELRASVSGLHDQQRTLHEQLATALDGTDAAAIGTLMLRIRAIGDQIKAAQDAADNKFEALLTPDQRTKFEAFQAAVQFLSRRGPGGPGGPR